MPAPKRYDLPPLARIETAWAPPWLVSGITQQGERHYRAGKPSDDAFIIGGTKDAVWMALGDGVGSKPMGHLGSRLATAAVQHHFAAHLERGEAITPDLMRAAFAAAHALIKEEAAAARRPLNDYATTLCAVLITGNTILAGTVGDSAIAAYTTHVRAGKPTPALIPFCSCPQPPTQTTFAITHEDWPNYQSIKLSTSPHIKGVVIATDGANGFYLHDPADDASPFDCIYLDAIDNAIEQLTPRLFCNFFAQYLYANEADNHDDRTILLAYRIPEHLRPPVARP